MVKNYLAMYFMMVLIMLGMSMLEWSQEPTGMVVSEGVTDGSTHGPVVEDSLASDSSVSDDTVLEITKVDIMDENFSSSDISVNGIQIGDSLLKTQNTLGYPDKLSSYIDPYKNEIINLEYSQTLGSEDVSLIVNVKNGVVQRLTLLPGFNQYLIGDTQYGYDKTEVYKRFGIPDHQEILKDYWVYFYDDKGFGVFLKRKDVIGYTFYSEGLDTKKLLA